MSNIMWKPKLENLSVMSQNLVRLIVDKRRLIYCSSPDFVLKANFWRYDDLSCYMYLGLLFFYLLILSVSIVGNIFEYFFILLMDSQISVYDDRYFLHNNLCERFPLFKSKSVTFIINVNTSKYVQYICDFPYQCKHIKICT